MTSPPPSLWFRACLIKLPETTYIFSSPSNWAANSGSFSAYSQERGRGDRKRRHFLLPRPVGRICPGAREPVTAVAGPARGGEPSLLEVWPLTNEGSPPGEAATPCASIVTRYESNMPTFDLTREPWITCARLDGTAVELGLRDVLTNAQQLKSLANESPLLDAALLRLCVAILHSCLGKSGPPLWKALQAQGRFDGAKISAYLDKWNSGFDLFDAERPFFQVARLVEQSKNYEAGRKPAREIIIEQSRYGAPRELFESRPSEGASISFAVAARWLVATQAFTTGGLLSRDAANGDPTAAKAGPLCGLAVVTIKGSTLFETLLLNLVRYPDEQTFPSTEQDAPAWEQAPLNKFEKRPCRGWLDWLTWQSRRMQLFANEAGVDEFLLLNGRELLTATDEPPTEPMSAYRYHDGLKKMLPIAFSRERALWRDSTALYQVAETEQFRAARVVADLTKRDVNHEQELRLQVYGQLPNKASVIFTRAETIPLPVKLLQDEKLVGILRDELARAETAQSALRGALTWAFQQILSLGDRKPDSKDVASLLESSRALSYYWAGVKPHFDTFIIDLVRTGGEAQTLERFRSALAAEAEARFEQAVLNSATPTRAMKGLARGRNKLTLDLIKAGVRTRRNDDPGIKTHEEATT